MAKRKKTDSSNRSKEPTVPETIPVSAFAETIHMSVGFVYRLIKMGKLPVITYGDGPKARKMIRKADAEKYIKQLNA